MAGRGELGVAVAGGLPGRQHEDDDSWAGPMRPPACDCPGRPARPQDGRPGLAGGTGKRP